jgi:hypothetical protein
MDQILNQARNHLVCPVCKGGYGINEIRLRGFIDNTYIFQAFCSKGHEPVMVTYLASLHRLEKPISAYFHTLSGKKITPETVKEAECEIEAFNGRFKELFTK